MARCSVIPTSQMKIISCSSISPALGLLALNLLAGCAHSFYYTPEVAGDGAKFSKGGVVYSLPATSPIYKMKMAYLGITTRKVPHSDSQEKVPLMRVRLYFIRKASPTTPSEAYLDPKEVTLDLDSNGAEIVPAAVFAHSKKRPIVALTTQTKQAVDFLYRLPNADHKELTIQHFSLKWTVHLDADKSITQSTRFDRGDSRPDTGSEMFPEDSMYPYDESPLLAPNPEWMMDDWDFWGI